MRYRLIVLAVITSLGVSLFAGVTPAAAHDPQLTLDVSSDQWPWMVSNINWDARGVPSGAQLILQRRHAPATQYTTYRTLRRMRNGITLHIPVGKWFFRLVVEQDKSIAARTSARQLDSYAKVRFSTLCPEGTTSSQGCTRARVQPSADSYFAGMTVAAATFPDFSTDYSFGASSCDFLQVSFTGDQQSQDSGARTWLRLSSAQTTWQSRVQPGSIRRMGSFEIEDQPFTFAAASDSTSPVDAVVHGKGWCYTRDGLPLPSN